MGGELGGPGGGLGHGVQGGVRWAEPPVLQVHGVQEGSGGLPPVW